MNMDEFCESVFRCPNCGGSCFGTFFPDGVGRWDTAKGMCHGHAVNGTETGPCGFVWMRSDDDRVFVTVRRKYGVEGA